MEPIPDSQRPFNAHLLGQLRQYEDAPSLDRAWKRLARSQGAFVGRRTVRKRRVLRALSSAALLLTGTLLGVFIERSSTEVQQFTVRSESFRPAVDEPSAMRPASSAPDAARRSVGYGEQAVADDDILTAGSSARALAVRPLTRPANEEPELSTLGSGVGPLDEKSSAPLAYLAAYPGAPYPGIVVQTTAARRAEWMLLAEHGDFSGAYQQLAELGGFDQLVATASPGELMLLVDVARAVGRQGQAIQALRVVLEHYQEDENAPLAAMMLGNLLSRSGDAKGAAEAFALNRSLSPGGDFAEDALVREFDMAITASKLPAAEQLRAQYERDYPEGKHGEALRADVERLAQQLAPVDASEAASEGEGEQEGEEFEASGAGEGEAPAAPSQPAAPSSPTAP